MDSSSIELNNFQDQDVPFVVIEEERTKSVGEDEISTIDGQPAISGYEEFGRTKRVKYIFHSFLRDHYPKIIKVMLIIITLLLSYIIITTVTSGKETVVEHLKSQDFKKLQHMESTVADKTNSLFTVRCARIFCEFDSPCKPFNNSYLEIKRYSCCNCLPKGYTLKYYMLSKRTGKVQMLVQAENTHPEDLSAFDLAQLDSLTCLYGTWDIIEITDTVSFLSYVDPEPGCIEPGPDDPTPGDQ